MQAWLESGADGASHQGFPVVDAAGDLLGVVTRRDLLASGPPAAAPVRDAIKRAPVVAYEDNSLREAADHMVAEDIGRLPVVSRSAPRRAVAMLTRSDLLAAHQRRLAAQRPQRVLTPRPRRAPLTNKTARAT